VNLTTHLQLVPWSRKFGSIHPLPIRLYGVVLNELSTGTTLPFTLGCGETESTSATNWPIVPAPYDNVMSVEQLLE
jgi:hypothetical protein